MKYPLFSYGGLPVISSIHAVTPEPTRKHVKSPWMSESYHKRIQKKWRKRFGVQYVPGAFLAFDKLIAHPDVIEQLKQEIR